MNAFTDFIIKDRRLCLLRTLAGQTDATLNESLLQSAAASFGHNVSRSVIKSDLRWLADVDAIALKEIGEYLIATLKERGLDHVERRSTIDGVAAPKLGGI